MKKEISLYLSTLGRSPRTIQTYRQRLKGFVKIVGNHAPLDTGTYIKYLMAIRKFSPSTIRVSISAVKGLYDFCNAGDERELHKADKHYLPRAGKRIIDFDIQAIEKTIDHLKTHRHGIIPLRNRAFAITLADTGLRIGEACALKRGDIDWKNHRAVIIGKGNKQAEIFFSKRSISALQDYLRARAKMDGASGKPLNSLPLFARHGINDSNRVLPIQENGIRKSIQKDMRLAGVSVQRIHAFRHYFATMYYARTHDIKATQMRARHSSIEMTDRYTHLIDDQQKLYDEVMNDE